MTAKRILFKTIAGFHTTISVWESHGSWYWDALGNSAKAKTEQDAIEAAKRWIKSKYR